MKFKWEKIDGDLSESLFDYTCRAKVIGGWIVKNNLYIEDDEGELCQPCISMVFIPDPDHEWIID